MFEKDALTPRRGGNHCNCTAMMDDGRILLGVPKARGWFCNAFTKRGMMYRKKGKILYKKKGYSAPIREYSLGAVLFSLYLSLFGEAKGSRSVGLV